MATEEGKESLQDLLRELLASTPPEEAVPAAGEETEAGDGAGGEEVEGPQGAAAQQSPVAGVTTEGTEATLPIAAPAAPEVASPAAAGPPLPENTMPQAPLQADTEAPSMLLEGTLEVKVAPPILPNRLSLLERALKEKEEVVWLGTWGRPREGITLRLRLKGPLSPSHLFEDMAVVERLEPAKAGQARRLKVTLAPEAAKAGEAAPISSEPPLSAVPQGPALPEQAQTSVYLEALAPSAGAGQVDLEVSPIASLEALNRLERLLSSFSPGLRVVNVLSLDGVSTVLVTMEGMDGGTLARKLQESMGAIKLEVRPDRLVAELPAQW